MLPELFSIGPFTVYGYGLMLGIAFITANLVLNYDYEKRGLDKAYATEVTLIAIIFGIIGSKLLHLIENWHAFIKDPIEMAFSPGGLTFYGGLILATIAIFIYTRKTRINFFYVADITAPALALAYGIGRIGCHLAGDGDYGIPTTLPWGTNYENGIVKPVDMFAGSDIAAGFPNGLVPNDTPLHPTPIYEFRLLPHLFFFLRYLLKKDWRTGQIFGIYLIFSGLFRFLVEFIRLNPRLVFGLSEAQLISIGLMLSGAALFVMMKTAPSLNSLNDQYKTAASKKPKAKKENNAKIFGRKPVLELLKSKQDILKVYFLRGIKGDVIDEIKGIVIRQKLPWQELQQDKFKKLAGDGNHQGVVALTPEKRLLEEEECLEMLAKNQDELIILLDSIQDTHNLGAILRTAECAGVKTVITTKFNSAPLNETVSKVSAGALNHLQICAVRNLSDYIKKLKDIGYWIGASSLEESLDYSEPDYSGKIAFIMGNEEKGVRRLLLQLSDFKVKIPMRGKIQSLNVSVAAGILLFEIMKKKAAGRPRV